MLTRAAPRPPVIVEVPHAGLDIPAVFLEAMVAPARAIARDADLYVDRLYADAPLEGATHLVARVSRYAIDVNRSEADVDADVVEGGRSDIRVHHGLVWRTHQRRRAEALSRRLRREEVEERLNLVWRPYHRELSALVEQKIARFGIALVVAAHSMPSLDRGPSSSGREVLRDRADVVPGTRGRRSAGRRFIDTLEECAVSNGWSVRHDDPYSGGFTTQHYGRPADRVHVLQVELARRLYLNESDLRPLETFDAVRAWCRRLVAHLSDAALKGESFRST